MQPQLPIDVDPNTGVWTTDALPMLYVPRHFFTNNHVAVEEALGRDTYAEILYKAGYKSAYHWCDKEAKQHGISGMAVFEHYLNRLSQRGWGIFKIVEDNLFLGGPTRTQHADPAVRPRTRMTLFRLTLLRPLLGDALKPADKIVGD